MKQANPSANVVRSAEAERIDALLNICHKHYGLPCRRAILEMGVFSLGVGFLIVGIAELCNRSVHLSSVEVREILENLKSDTELQMGKDLLAKRKGSVCAGDLIPLIKHLEAERRKEMLEAFDNKLNEGAVPA